MVFLSVLSSIMVHSSSEFQDFATKYEFEHVTSSLDTHNQMGSAVKTAKRLMEKALDAKRDPRNTNDSLVNVLLGLYSLIKRFYPLYNNVTGALLSLAN